MDAVCVVDAIGDPKKIATKEARMTDNPRELMMAENVANVIAATPYFKDGFSFQTGVDGPSSAICALQDKGLVDYILDTQDFDQGAAAHLFTNPHHVEIDLSEYANAGNKGAYVNKLDYVVLSALEIDTKFNVNVITGSDGVLRGAPGGHPDTAAGSKCCIIVTPPDPWPHGDGVQGRRLRHHPWRLRGRAGDRSRHRRQSPAPRTD